MDRLFVSSHDGSKKNVFKLIGGKKTKRRSSKSSEAPTEYFPYAGGDGIDGYEFHPKHMSYEPAESMLDSDVHIEPEDGGLRKSMNRILLRGSKYEVYQSGSANTTDDEENDTSRRASQIPQPSPRQSPLKPQRGAPPAVPRQHPSELRPGREESRTVLQPKEVAIPPQMNTKAVETPAPAAAVPRKPGVSKEPETRREVPPGASAGMLDDAWTFQWLDDIPTSLESAVPLVRSLARRSMVLRPIDTLADQIDGLEMFVAAVELFIFMLVGDQLAKIVQLVCSPATLLVKMVFRLI